MTRLPDFVAPQLAKLVRAPPAGANWVHEVKFDGYRLQMRVEKGRARLRTRKGLDWTEKFPEIAADGARLANCLIDGEICALNGDGAADFGALQLALSEGRTGALVYFVFDCLFAEGRDVRKLPLSARKEALQEVLKPASRSQRLRFVPHFGNEGHAMLEAACKMDMEGIISKRLDAPYVSGRADYWTKSKCRGGQEVVIGGWRGDDRTLRSLLVGTHQDGKLVYMGRVGTGYTQAVAADLLKKLKPLKRAKPAFANPPRAPDLNWVEPRLVAEIAFENVTADGLFRQAAFKGLRADKPADQVVPEVPAGAKEKRAMAAKVSRVAAKAKSADNVVLGVTISHPDKALWPKSKAGPAVTKLDLARYMAAAADRMLPHIEARPISIVRTPDGIEGETFYQRHALKGTQAPTLAIQVSGEAQPFLGVDSAAALVALAQQAVTEIHPWGSRTGDPDSPERIILDLDPAPDVKFDRVVEGAQELRKRLIKLGFEPFVKTTGGKGLHVVIAIKPGSSWAEAKAFAKAVASKLEADMPERYTTTLAKKARTGKIFIDYLRNDRTSTGVAPWSPRARPGAPVAVPLSWAQVKAGLDPAEFTLLKMGPVLKKADPWAGLAKSAKALGPAMKKMGL